MKRFPNWTILAFAFTLCSPMTALAGWQVASKGSAGAIPSDPFFQAGTQGTAFMPSYGNDPWKTGSLQRSSGLYAISISGSLKENVERIMDRYHWKVIWKSPYDYNFDGRITGNSLPSVIGKLFQPFPLQAQLYMSNRTMIVVPREKA